ncbi:pantoate-beta-alanine ligase [Ophiostoma piceae UAMH 11346]|uniref:Pantoate--beta-alanine ligase n=1 Tax=Ophiostoma piceae (strain UAMH 11346) TaxID=1262450 RepID=S3DB06_OPHP1|nr:pantoate-beta-alanine ligase [Ophiostoma piceae UAMH 11346]
MMRGGASASARHALAGARLTPSLGRHLTTSARSTLPLMRSGNAADAARPGPESSRLFQAASVHHETVPQAVHPVPSTPQAASTRPGPSEDGHDTIPGTGIRVFRTVDALRGWRRQQLLSGRTVGLVPTMGALHAGHLDLVRSAARDNDDVVVSIYVNPTQFGVHEDLGSYPRTWEADGQQLASLQVGFAKSRDSIRGNVSAVFAPTTSVMYPSGPPSQEVDGNGSFVTITPVGKLLEGASRPTFFRGVATVCMKLFLIVLPERAYFGQKDVQQTVVLRRMVKDFCIPLEIVVGQTVREQPDGLALSSRNVYLGTRRRAVANVLRRSLLAAAEHAKIPTATHANIMAAAHRVADETLAAQRQLLPGRRALFEIDYLSLSDFETMEELGSSQTVDPAKGAILSGAVRMLPVEEPQPGEDLGHSNGPLVRLIDNIVIQPTN